MSKSNIFKKIIILVLILALPGFLYYLLTAKGKNRYLPLSYFGPKTLSGTSHKIKGVTIPDTLYHSLPAFTLTDQDGQTVSLKTLSEKILIVNFFYTRCPNICGVVNNNISGLIDEYSRNKMVQFVTITVDPEHDSVPVIKAYANKYKANPSKWMFLTGDTATIYSLSRNGFLVNALQEGSADFIYSDKIILVDKKKQLRGYYSGTDADEITRLDNEIKVQITEELRNRDKPLY